MKAQYTYEPEDLREERAEDPEQYTVVVHKLVCDDDYQLSFGMGRTAANSPGNFKECLFDSLKALKADVKMKFPDVFEKLEYQIV